MEIGAIQSKKPPQKKGFKEWPKTPGAVCQYCGKKNHTAAQCQICKHDQNNQGQSSQRKKKRVNKRSSQKNKLQQQYMESDRTLYLNAIDDEEVTLFECWRALQDNST